MSEHRRHWLLRLTQFMLIIAAVSASMPFWWRLMQSHKATQLLRIERSPNDDSLQVVDGPRGPYHVRLLILGSNKNLHIFFMPFANGAYMLPQGQWFSVGGSCRDWRYERGVLACDDGNPMAMWTTEGRPLASNQLPLMAASFHYDASARALEVNVPDFTQRH